MALRLHDLDSQEHIEDLKDRLYGHFAGARARAGRRLALTSDEVELIELLALLVRAMDRDTITTKEVLDIFTRRVPGFSFAKWLVDMVDEDVYFDVTFSQAA